MDDLDHDYYQRIYFVLYGYHQLLVIQFHLILTLHAFLRDQVDNVGFK